MAVRERYPFFMNGAKRQNVKSTSMSLQAQFCHRIVYSTTRFTSSSVPSIKMIMQIILVVEHTRMKRNTESVTKWNRPIVISNPIFSGIMANPYPTRWSRPYFVACDWSHPNVCQIRSLSECVAREERHNERNKNVICYQSDGKKLHKGILLFASFRSIKYVPNT